MRLSSHWAGLLVFVLALVLRLAYVLEDDAVLGLDVSRLDQTDNHVFAAWARIIADGDLLCREQPHAYHHWTSEVAPEGRWLEWYGGEQIYHQAPLYPYLIGAVFALAGDEHLHVGLFQALLGALTCLLTWALGCRVATPRAGLAAGLLLAFCGPFFFYDAFILRDGPMAFFVVLATWALTRAVDRDRIGSWLLAGMTLGLFTLAKETGLPLLMVTLVALALWRRRRPGLLLRTAAVLLLGWAVVTAPAFARNAVVGAPLTKLSTRGPEVFVTGNAQGQTGIGWNPPSRTLRRILQDSNFSLTKTMALTVATHRAEPWGYAELLWDKTAAFFSGHEVPNNVDFYLHRSHLSTLSIGFVSVGFLAPAALLGLLLGIPRRRKLAVSYLMFGAITGSVVLLYILARFRLQALPLMAVFAGLTVDWFLTTARARHWGRLLSASALLAVLVAWSWSDADPFGEKNKYSGIMLKLAKIGDFDQAQRYRDMLLEKVLPDLGESEQDRNLEERLARLHQAFELFAESNDQPEHSPGRHLLLGRGYTALIDVTKRGDMKDFIRLATRHFNLALDLDPRLRGARYGLGQVRQAVETHPSRFDQAPDLGEALAWYRDELAVHPDHGEAHRDCGLIFDSWGQMRQAAHHLLEADRLGAADGPALAALARLSIDGTNRDLPGVSVGEGEAAVYDPLRSLPLAERALALAPDDPFVLEKCADVLLGNQRWDESVALLEQLLELQPWRETYLTERMAAFRRQQANKRQAASAEHAAAVPDAAVEPQGLPEQAEQADTSPDGPSTGDAPTPTDTEDPTTSDAGDAGTPLLEEGSASPADDGGSQAPVDAEDHR